MDLESPRGSRKQLRRAAGSETLYTYQPPSSDSRLVSEVSVAPLRLEFEQILESLGYLRGRRGECKWPANKVPDVVEIYQKVEREATPGCRSAHLGRVTSILSGPRTIAPRLDIHSWEVTAATWKALATFRSAVVHLCFRTFVCNVASLTSYLRGALGLGRSQQPKHTPGRVSRAHPQRRLKLGISYTYGWVRKKLLLLDGRRRFGT